MNKPKFTLALIVGLSCLFFYSSVAARQGMSLDESLSLAVFDVDATPPVGSMLAYDRMENRDNLGLRAKGIIVSGSGLPIVLCAIDWIGIANESQDVFKSRLAKAASTIPSRVAVHAVHQHDAPISDWSAEKILVDSGLDPQAFDSSFDRVLLDRLEEAIKAALSRSKPLTHVGTGKAEVRQVASNRRILGPDGKVSHFRSSSTKDAAIRDFPEGLIDPEVSLISFWNGDEPLAVLSYYAVHPQSYYLTKIANPDFPGIARYMRQISVPEALHVHFNGAGANIAAGKYNDGSKINRSLLAERLAAGMEQAWENTSKQALNSGDIFWQQEPVLLPADESIAGIEQEMHSQNARWLTNNMQKLAWYKRQQMGRKIDIGCLTLGDTRILHLPGELFAEYQLAAKAERPDLFVAMAAYGDYGPFYIGTADAYPQGGYEINASPVTAESESVIMTAIKKLLHQPHPQQVWSNPYLLRTESEIPLKTLEEWEAKEKGWQNDMASIMGTLPSRENLIVPQLTYLDSIAADNFTRYHVKFKSDPRNDVTAYLYLPHQSKDRPAMLVLHSTGEGGKKIVDGEGPLENRAVARELAGKGYVVMAPDYPSFGEQKNHDFSNDGFPSGTLLGVWNHMRCIDVLSEMPAVDPDRIGVIGHSLGGHNALFVAAHDPRIKAVVSSCGWTPFSYYDIGDAGSKKYGGRLGPWAQDRYMPAIRKHLPDARLPFDFTDIIAMIAPRPVFTNAPVKDSNFSVEGVKHAIAQLRPVYQWMGFPEHLQVRYPDAGHDFPPEVRKEAYAYLDDFFGFSKVKKY
ncbi:Alpha/beta hydrolase family protein [Cyclobacterium lianum]|uniref:Alpha/beta hydrolase family protein n=1 Tax=Cyclobacterium lianum TaxID=388280 RepID=A0A1M7P717_9BACT|nr:alpha/beta fold hydrolase [Cyclobacterium lianum]SHN12488.1 Alpha/beta hydrolase family protein [Cyclobacterium lianum]